MKKILLLIILTPLLSLNSEAQKKSGNPSYKTAIGVRFQPFGVSLKSNITGKKRSFEFIGYFDDGFTLSGLYYWNFILNQPLNLKLYVGGSAQGGYKDNEKVEGVVFGVGGVVGLDYKFLKAPINISLDWQPNFQVGKKFDEFQGNWGGIAARFCF